MFLLLKSFYGEPLLSVVSSAIRYSLSLLPSVAGLSVPRAVDQGEGTEQGSEKEREGCCKLVESAKRVSLHSRFGFTAVFFRRARAKRFRSNVVTERSLSITMQKEKRKGNVTTIGIRGFELAFFFFLSLIFRSFDSFFFSFTEKGRTYVRESHSSLALLPFANGRPTVTGGVGPPFPSCYVSSLALSFILLLSSLLFHILLFIRFAFGLSWWS